MAKNRDLADLSRRFAAIPKNIKTQVQPAIDRGADDLVARMELLAPDEDGTGALKRSIKRSDGPVELSATVSAGGAETTGPDGFDHAIGQEFGTTSMERNSFFWSSVNTLKRRVRGRIDRAISKAIKEAWR